MPLGERVATRHPCLLAELRLSSPKHKFWSLAEPRLPIPLAGGRSLEVDAIVQVVRCFEDEDVHHVSGTVDPVRDIEVINTELILADLDSVRRRR